MNNNTLSQLSEHIAVIKDFPKKGIIFRNINTLMKHKLLSKSIEYMCLLIKYQLKVKIDYIVGVESRGFLFTELASLLDCGFVMMRKPGKLPTTKIVSYDKEYGTDSITIEDDVIEPNSNVLIVDDLIATGGTLCAAIELIQMINANPVGVIGLTQLTGLELNKKLLDSNVPILSLLKYHVDSTSTTLDFELNSHLSPFLESESSIFIKDFVPLHIKSEYNNFADTIVFSYPSAESLAENYIANNDKCRKGSIIWNKFPDSQPNVQFEHMSQLENKRIVFFMSVFDMSNLFVQLSMIKILPRQFIISLDIYICYYSVGTMERVDEEGTLATADTLASIISNCLESCKEGKPTIHIYDIHTLQNRFYFDYSKVQVKLHSAIPLLKKKINSDSIIVFPDDGAYKRFGRDFHTYKTIVCSKVRDGNKRTVTIKDKLNFPLDANNVNYSEIIIVDDLVQSGGTLIECKKALESHGYSNISAYVTHSVFPNNGWKKFLSCGFKTFYTTNSVPEVASKLPDSCFTVLKLFGDNDYKSIKVYVSSHDEKKLQVAWNYNVKTHKTYNIVVRGLNINSKLPKQLIGHDQISEESGNSFNNAKNYLIENCIQYDYLHSYVNALILDDDDKCYDSCFSYIFNKHEDFFILGYNFYKNTGNSHMFAATSIPKKYYDKCIEFKQEKTIGEIIQDECGIPENNFHEHFNKYQLTHVDVMDSIFYQHNDDNVV